MRIVILGAGTVGASIADMLCQHGHVVTIVDSDADRSRRLNETMDVRALTGSAAQSSVLFQAGVIEADLVLAVTGQDEVNIVAASLAKAMGARRAVARVYAPVFRDLSTFDYQRHFKIDRLLSLEHLSATELARGIRQSGTLATENFARGELEMRSVTVGEGVEAVGAPLKDLGLPRGIRVGSIRRETKTWIAGADDQLEPGDQITLLGQREEIDRVSDWFSDQPAPKLGIVLAGGGETGYHLAHLLEGPRYAVLLMEEDAQRCHFLASNLRHATVINSDATQRHVLEEERVGSADIFVACTGDDENNIMACVEARDIGAQTCMAVISRPDYASVVHRLGIDFTVSPREVMAQQVLGLLNSGALISRTPLDDGLIELLEIEVLEGVAATQHVLATLDLPPQCLVAAVITADYVRVPGADDRLRPGDTVLVLAETGTLDDVLRLFAPVD